MCMLFDSTNVLFFVLLLSFSYFLNLVIIITVAPWIIGLPGSPDYVFDHLCNFVSSQAMRLRHLFFVLLLQQADFFNPFLCYPSQSCSFYQLVDIF